MNKHTEVPCEQRLKKQARIPAGRLMFKNTRMRRLLFKKSGQVFLTQPLFLCFSKTFAIYGLHRASHSRNPTAIRIPGLRPPCSCPLTRSVRATSSARKLRFLAVRCTLINRKKDSVLHASMGLYPFFCLRSSLIAHILNRYPTPQIVSIYWGFEESYSIF